MCTEQRQKHRQSQRVCVCVCVWQSVTQAGAKAQTRTDTLGGLSLKLLGKVMMGAHCRGARP